MGRYIPPSDPLHDLGLISVVKRPSGVVISTASTTTVSAGTNRHHVQDTRAMETLLAQLSHLIGFNMEHSCFFVGIPYLETRTVECKTIFRVARSNKITLTGILRSSRGRQQFYRRGKTSHMIMGTNVAPRRRHPPG